MCLSVDPTQHSWQFSEINQFSKVEGKLAATDCFSGKAWFTAVNKLGLDGGHVQLLSLGNLIQVSVPILKTQFGSISERRTLMELTAENILTLVEYV